MRPDIKKDVFHLNWAPESVPAEDVSRKVTISTKLDQPQYEIYTLHVLNVKHFCKYSNYAFFE